MLKKSLPIVLFFLLFVGAFVYFQFIQETTESKSNDDTFKASEKDLPSYEQWVEDSRKPLESRLKFEKKIPFVYIGELNDSVIKEVALHDYDEYEVNFNEETKSLYFYNDQILPSQDTNLMIVKEAHSIDTLLEQEFIQTNGQETEIKLNPIYIEGYKDEIQPIDNEERLFLDEKVFVQIIDEKGTIEVDFNGEKFTLKENESKLYEKEKEVDGQKVRTKIAITNYGLWDTYNMQYQINKNNNFDNGF